MKIKKISVALAGVMSAVAIAGAAPLSPAAFLQNVATVANAAEWGGVNVDGNQVINENVNIGGYSKGYIGNSGKCVIVVNGNVNVGEYADLYVNSGSLLIVNGDMHLSEYAFLRSGTVVLTGSLTQDGYNSIKAKVVTEKNLTNIGYVAETDDYYEYFTSGGNIYTFNGSEFVETELEDVKKDTYIVAGGESSIFGTGWDGTNADNQMTRQADGTYQKTYTVDQAYSEVQLKVVKNGAEWYGNSDYSNISFALSGAGSFTVGFDPNTNTVSVTGDIVKAVEFEYSSVHVVGNGSGNWLNGVMWDPWDNEMREISEDVWEITFNNVGSGEDYQVVFAIDGAWTHTFGGSFSGSGVESDAEYYGDDIAFDLDKDSDITISLDLSSFDFATKTGAKFTISISPVAAVSEPAKATYEQVGSDYTSETETDNIASLWKITVTAGTDSIETLDVKLGETKSKEGEQTLDMPVITGAKVVLGAVVNLSSSDVRAKGLTVVVNGDDVKASEDAGLTVGGDDGNRDDNDPDF